MLADLLDRARHFASVAFAASTQSTYFKHIVYFIRWLIVVELLDHLEAPPEYILVLYCTFLARSVQYRTVKHYLKGMMAWYKVRGRPIVLGEMIQLHHVLLGMRREQSAEVQKKRPILPWMLDRWVFMLDPLDPEQGAIAMAMLLAFFALLRKSSLCYDSDSPMSTFQGLCRKDVTVDMASYSLRLSLRHAKTNQYGERVTCVSIAGVPGSRLDPVAMWEAFIAANPASPDDPAVCYVKGMRVLPLSHQKLVKWTKQLADIIGLNPAEVSGHSYRRGGATFAFQCGVDDLLIQRQGDWRSMVYREYLWQDPASALICSSRMGAAIRSGFHGVRD